MALSLVSLRVLGLSNVLAGPLCGYQPGLSGAEAVGIEVSGSDGLARHLGTNPKQVRRKMDASFVTVNASERPVTVNPKHPEGRTILFKLMAQAGALIENYRPGVMDRLELDYDMLCKVNLRLVYCTTSGFGKDGPLSDRPAYDQVIQGIFGVMNVTGDGMSVLLRVGYPTSDTVGGTMAALAVTTCLLDT